jgi:hypothetical protein
MLAINISTTLPESAPDVEAETVNRVPWAKVAAAPASEDVDADVVVMNLSVTN